MGIDPDRREALGMALTLKGDADSSLEAAGKFLAFLAPVVAAEKVAAPVVAAEKVVAEKVVVEKKARKATADDVRAALKEVAAVQGQPAAMAILAALGADSVSKLAEEHYAAAVAACREVPASPFD
jgi:hypothetical protein